MKTVLVPTDGSARSLRALTHALSLAEDVLLLNVQPPTDTPTLLLHMTQEAIDQAQREQGQRDLAAACQAVADAGRSARSLVLLGDPATCIASTAAAQQVDAIVMATHGRGALASLALGSTATRVVHLASVPVMLVK